MNDIDTLARTIWGEARNQGYRGMVAIANVIMNRVALSDRHAHFGDGTVESACLAPWQFSCWNANDPNRNKLQAVDERDTVFCDCLDIASTACASQLDDITNGATYYYLTNSPTPTWSIGQTPCATIGVHLFFKNIA